MIPEVTTHGTLNRRDVEFIENRLLAPAPELHDAIERLRSRGHRELGDRVAAALQNMTDECRAVRRVLADRARTMP